MENVQEAVNRLNLLAETGQFEELLNQADRFIAEEDAFAPFYLFKGNALRALGQAEAAIEAYHQAIAKDPNDALARTALGGILFERGDYINALTACDSAILIDNSFPDPYVYSGNVLVALGYPDQAVYAYHRAYTLDPGSADLGEMVATLYAQEGELEKAVDVFFSLIQTNPSDAALHVKMGVALMYLLQNGASHKQISQYATAWRQMVPKDEYVNQVASALIDNRVDFDPLTPKAVDALFTAYAGLYDSSMETGEAGMLQEMRDMAGKICDTQKADICDLGCGTGLTGAVLKDFAKTAGLTGVDLCSAMLDQAFDKKIYDKVFHSENSAFLMQNPNMFDLITAGNVFSYTRSLAEQIAAMKTALKVGGHILFTFRKNTFNRQETFLYPPYYYLFTERMVKKVVEEAGLVVKEMRPLTLTERVDQSIEMVLCSAQKVA